jgi:hypothetical protein
MAVAVSVATMDRVGLITAAAIRAGSMESTAASAEAAAAATPAASTASAVQGSTAAASTARIGADGSERQAARHEKYGCCSLD